MFSVTCWDIFVKTMVYNRASLDEIMKMSSTDNVYEWIDEQVGVLLKFAVPVLSVSRLEDGLAASSRQVSSKNQKKCTESERVSDRPAGTGRERERESVCVCMCVTSLSLFLP